MARSLLPSRVPNTVGTDPAPAAATVDGFAFMLNPRTVLVVETTAGNPTNMTVDTPGTIDAGALPNKVIAVPAAAKRGFCFGKEIALYRQDDGTCWVNFDTLTGVTAYVWEP